MRGRGLKGTTAEPNKKRDKKRGYRKEIKKSPLPRFDSGGNSRDVVETTPGE